MNVVIAIDSFKSSLSSIEAANAIKEGINRVTDADIIINPIADGGEGTIDALVSGMNGIVKSLVVTGPLGEKVKASWGIINEGEAKIAVIEMAKAAGITLIKPEELNPLYTTTFGVGEIIKAAVNEGCRRFIVGIGGSATNDGGVGMLTALGFEFLDKEGAPIKPGAIGLKDLAAISTKNVLPELKECVFRVACDVKNPLCGDNGCSAVYGPQKGATEAMVRDMDAWLNNYGKLSCGDMNYEGTGAAGGLGFAFLTFLNAKLEPGIDIIIEETGLNDKIKNADIVITGEGRMDSQTIMGKVPVGVAKLAKKHSKKVIAFCGCEGDGANICNEYGIDAFFPILRRVVTLDEALNKEVASDNLTKTAEQVFRLISAI